MGWDVATERNREALIRVLAALIAMAGLEEPVARLARGVDVAGRSSSVSNANVPESTAEAPTLTRYLLLAVLRLLRPAESAVRRLVIIAARGIEVTLPPQRPPRPKPKSIFVRDGIGTGIVLPKGCKLNPRPAPRSFSLAVTDPVQRFGQRRIAQLCMPRIGFPGTAAPFPVPPPPAPDDEIDAMRLAQRLAALSYALDDLPGHAQRFARWRARAAAGAQNRESRNAGRIMRLWPLRPGKPPGQVLKPTHEIHEILEEIHCLAFDVLNAPNTS